jgi:hypothetical protein
MNTITNVMMMFIHLQLKLLIGKNILKRKKYSMAHFIDFEEIISDLRVAMNKAVTEELKEHNIGLFTPIELSTLDTPLYFIHPTELDGKSRANSILLDGKDVVIKTDVGECVDFMDLETDDMVAIYEYIYYELN